VIILLDTDVIFDHLNGRSRRTEYLEQLIDQGHSLACCPVNVTEVYAGLRPGEESKTKHFLESLEFFPVTFETAMKAGLLRRDWRRKGHTLSYLDVTIAAVAISNRLPLATGNGKHFPMPEIQLHPLP
jgi:predicted nucleic acid-binding protein